MIKYKDLTLCEEIPHTEANDMFTINPFSSLCDGIQEPLCNG